MKGNGCKSQGFSFANVGEKGQGEGRTIVIATEAMEGVQNGRKITSFATL